MGLNILWFCISVATTFLPLVMTLSTPFFAPYWKNHTESTNFWGTWYLISRSFFFLPAAAMMCMQCSSFAHFMSSFREWETKCACIFLFFLSSFVIRWNLLLLLSIIFTRNLIQTRMILFRMSSPLWFAQTMIPFRMVAVFIFIQIFPFNFKVLEQFRSSRAT